MTSILQASIGVDILMFDFSKKIYLYTKKNESFV